MENIFQIPKEDLGELFTQTAFKMGIGLPSIIEKDFWVVKLLQLLFSEDNFFKHHVFKGGTSLSKCFNLIQRFSEDLDITISRSFLGFNESIEGISQLSNKKKKRYFDELELAATNHVSNLARLLSERISFEFDIASWQLYVSPEDKQKIIFEYPKSLALPLYPDNLYVKPKILLEFGCRGELTPANAVGIKTYAQQCFEDIFSKEDVIVNVLNPERTFWEKITLLHMLAHQNVDKLLQPRMARHYYDIYKLSNSSFMESAKKNASLLESVANHKSIYFSSKQASYHTAKPGSLKLIPNHQLLKNLEMDYHAMSEMFFHETISFNEIMKEINDLEKKLNKFELPEEEIL